LVRVTTSIRSIFAAAPVAACIDRVNFDDAFLLEKAEIAVKFRAPTSVDGLRKVARSDHAKLSDRSEGFDFLVAEREADDLLRNVIAPGASFPRLAMIDLALSRFTRAFPGNGTVATRSVGGIAVVFRTSGKTLAPPLERGRFNRWRFRRFSPALWEVVRKVDPH
jgi:hypothetical protein